MVYFLDVCGKKNSIQDRVWGKNVGAVRDLLDHPQEKFSANFMIWGGVSWKGLIPPNRPIFVDELKVSCFLQIDQFFEIGFSAIMTAFPYSKLSYPIGWIAPNLMLSLLQKMFCRIVVNRLEFSLEEEEVSMVLLMPIWFSMKLFQLSKTCTMDARKKSGRTMQPRSTGKSTVWFIIIYTLTRDQYRYTRKQSSIKHPSQNYRSYTSTCKLESCLSKH